MEKDTEYRKIQRVGRGSYILTLPKEWVQELNLEKGSQVAVKKTENSSLLLAPRKEGKGEEKPIRKECRIVADLSADPQSLCRKIASLYVVSADIIHVRFKQDSIPPEYRFAIHNFIKNFLLGSEILDETNNEIRIQILVNHPDFPVDSALRRMAILAISAHKEIIQSLKSMDGKLINSVIKACEDVQRLNLYVIRQLKYNLERNKYRELGFKSPKEFLGYRIVANNIKSIADNALNLAQNIILLKKMVDNDLLQLNESIDEELYSQIINFSSNVSEYFGESLKALFKRDYDYADKLISEMEHLIVQSNDLVNIMSTKKIDPNISSILRLILDSSRRIIEYAGNIAEVTLNRTVEEEIELRKE